MKVVDYTEHSPVEDYLAKTYGATRFNAIVDAVGLQPIFYKCPHFLIEGKPYVTVGPRQPNYTYFGMLSTLGTMAKNFLWPRILGGTPRPYVQAATATTLNGMQELAGLVEQGIMKVHVSAEFKMEDAIQVSRDGEYDVSRLTLCRHMRNRSADTRRVKSLSKSVSDVKYSWLLF